MSYRKRSKWHFQDPKFQTFLEGHAPKPPSSGVRLWRSKKIPLPGFQAKQQKRGKIDVCARRTIQSKICPNSPLKQKRGKKTLKRSECIATNPCRLKPLCY